MNKTIKCVADDKLILEIIEEHLKKKWKYIGFTDCGWIGIWGFKRTCTKTLMFYKNKNGVDEYEDRTVKDAEAIRIFCIEESKKYMDKYKKEMDDWYNLNFFDQLFTKKPEDPRHYHIWVKDSAL